MVSRSSGTLRPVTGRLESGVSKRPIGVIFKVVYTMKIIALWQKAIRDNNEDLIITFSSCHNIVNISLPIRRDVTFNFVRQLEVFWEAWKMQGMLFEVAQSFRCECDVQCCAKKQRPYLPSCSTVWSMAALVCGELSNWGVGDVGFWFRRERLV
jgi:hypothetical protein